MKKLIDDAEMKKGLISIITKDAKIRIFLMKSVFAIAKRRFVILVNFSFLVCF